LLNCVSRLHMRMYIVLVWLFGVVDVVFRDGKKLNLSLRDLLIDIIVCCVSHPPFLRQHTRTHKSRFSIDSQTNNSLWTSRMKCVRKSVDGGSGRTSSIPVVGCQCWHVIATKCTVKWTGWNVYWITVHTMLGSVKSWHIRSGDPLSTQRLCSVTHREMSSSRSSLVSTSKKRSLRDHQCVVVGFWTF
jgi:hypothetical protein